MQPQAHRAVALVGQPQVERLPGAKPHLLRSRPGLHDPHPRFSQPSARHQRRQQHHQQDHPSAHVLPPLARPPPHTATGACLRRRTGGGDVTVIGRRATQEKHAAGIRLLGVDPKSRAPAPARHWRPPAPSGRASRACAGDPAHHRGDDRGLEHVRAVGLCARRPWTSCWRPCRCSGSGSGSGMRQGTPGRRNRRLLRRQAGRDHLGVRVAVASLQQLVLQYGR